MKRILLSSSSPPLSAGNDLLVATLKSLIIFFDEIHIYAPKISISDLCIDESTKPYVFLNSEKSFNSEEYLILLFLTQDIRHLLKMKEIKRRQTILWIHELGNFKRHSIIKTTHYILTNLIARISDYKFIMADENLIKGTFFFSKLMKPSILGFIPIPYITDQVEILEVKSEKKYDLIFIGDIQPYKGLAILIKSVKKVADNGTKVRLLIVSTSKINFGILSKYPLLEITHIKEKQNNESLISYVRASRYLIIPYKNITATSLIALAYSNGVPTISSNQGYLKYHTESSNAGVLFNIKDLNSICTTITNALNSSKNENAFSKASLNYYKKTFSLDAYREKLLLTMKI